MIQQAIAILQQAGFDLTAQELAEILWLAVHLEESEKPEKRSAFGSSASLSPQPNIPNILKPDPPQTQTQQPQSPSLPQIPEPSFPVTLPSSVPPPAKTTETPIRIPAAVSLRNSLDANIRPFAQLKAQVLRRLGGVYADLAEKLDAANKTPADNNTPWTLEDYLINEPPRRQGRQEKERTPSVILHPEGSSAEEGTKFFKFDVLTVNAQGQEIKREKRQASYYTEQLGDSVTLKMVAIPGGKFMMGSPEGEGYEREKPQHEVTVQPFFMGKYPVTQAQWRVVAALPRVNRYLNPDRSRFKGDNRPVEYVSWYNAVQFCARLSRKTGREYRLPSEAEWEYACRAGTTTPFHFGETITDKLAKYNAEYTFADEPKGEDRPQTTPVGKFPPNAFGLYDMHGNIWEWCADVSHENYQGAPIDGSEWSDNDNQEERGIGARISNLWKRIRGSSTQKDNYNHYRLVRGGSWSNDPDFCRSASRYRLSLVYDYGNLGFRVVCVPPSRIISP